MGRVLDLQNVKSRHLPLLTGGGGLKQQRGVDHMDIGVLVFRCLEWCQGVRSFKVDLQSRQRGKYPGIELRTGQGRLTT
jgi:hypothetical protein